LLKKFTALQFCLDSRKRRHMIAPIAFSRREK
jgi:hypothetical protein